MPTVDEIIRTLDLRPLPSEGGLFKEMYRSGRVLPPAHLPAGDRGSRSLATAIYYLITRDDFSALHRVRGDEVFHFYAGDPVDLWQLREDGTSEWMTLGIDLTQGMRPQIVVPGGIWQALVLRPGGSFALLGTTMSPGFDVADFELGERTALVKQFPAYSAEIERLTR